jgi:hypothetical protein
MLSYLRTLLVVCNPVRDNSNVHSSSELAIVPDGDASTTRVKLSHSRYVDELCPVRQRAESALAQLRTRSNLDICLETTSCVPSHVFFAEQSRMTTHYYFCSREFIDIDISGYSEPAASRVDPHVYFVMMTRKCNGSHGACSTTVVLLESSKIHSDIAHGIRVDI